MKYELIGKAVYFPELKLLAIADLHIGYEEALNNAGVMLPRSQYKEILEDLDKIFSFLEEKKKKVEEIAICGDLKHEFSKILKQEWQETSDFLDYLAGKAGKVVLIRGNHDNILGPIAEKNNIEIKDYYIKESNNEKICFMHGDKMFPEVLDKNIKTIVIGHKHPAVTLRDKEKSERYKCFLEGKWKGKKILILPSFFPLVEGSEVNVEEIEETSLAFRLNLVRFGVYVPSGAEVLSFGKLGELGD